MRAMAPRSPTVPARCGCRASASSSASAHGNPRTARTRGGRGPHRQCLRARCRCSGLSSPPAAPAAALRVMRSGSRSTVLSVDLDVGAAPSTASWAERVAALCAAWYPLVHALLESPGYTPPSRIVLRMVPTIGDGRRSPGTPGVTSGTVITVGADWVRLHPEDTGLVLHELVHVVQ